MFSKVTYKVLDYLPSLTSRNYRLFLIGQGISLIGSWMQSVAEQWLIYPVLTTNKSLLGIVSAVNMVPTFLFVLFAGVLVDRISKKQVFIFSQILYAGVAFSLFFLIYTHTIQIWHVFVAAFVSGVIFSIENTVRQVFVLDLVDKKHVASAMSLGSALFNSARAIGPALAGITIAAVGIAPAYLFNSISFFAVIVSVYLMKFTDVSKKPVAHPPIFQGMKEGIAYIKRNKIYAAILFIVGLVTFFSWPASILQPVFAHDIFKTGEVGFGLIQSCFGIGAVIGGLSFSKVFEKIKRKYFLLFIGIGVITVTLSFYAWVPWFWVGLILQVIGGWALSTTYATANTLIVLSIPQELRGRILSMYTFIFIGGMPFGALLSSLLVSKIGPQWTVFSSVVVMGITIFGFIVSQKGKIQEKIQALT